MFLTFEATLMEQFTVTRRCTTGGRGWERGYPGGPFSKEINWQIGGAQDSLIGAFQLFTD